ncbi:chromate transporter [Pelagirhabdus alkalitolerans]|uniref:Chromate transporter n=1 Tax=Pelagirhabdus alkalitolerans TaxID=1612202 RepID=A0A1G6H809_9BACI|nr:chromate transporter [Pelagirhabdus alkalitolerans]SDB90284.1 chromate transporter [Pelagirhabdus alkalitolerans]
MNKYLQLFLTFAKIGSVTFGGGYAMLPILERDVVERHGWVTREELLDYYAIGQTTPGIIAVNTATFIGYKHLGVIGAISATLGIILPSLIIISIIASLLVNITDSEMLQHAFAGIRVSVYVLIIHAVIKLSKSSLKDWFTISLFAIVLLLTLLVNMTPVVFVVGAGVCGYLLYVFKKRGESS